MPLSLSFVDRLQSGEATSEVNYTGRKALQVFPLSRVDEVHSNGSWEPELAGLDVSKQIEHPLQSQGFPFQSFLPFPFVCSSVAWMGTSPERWAARRDQSKGGSPLGLCEVVRGGGSSCSMPTDPTATHRADRGWSEVWKRRPLRTRRGVMWGTGVRQGRAQGRRLVRRSGV